MNLCNELMLLMYSYAYYLSIHAYYVIFLLFMDDAWKKEEILVCAKIDSHAFIDIQIRSTNSGGVLYFLMNCQDLFQK
jgi:hypothetical protein